MNIFQLLGLKPDHRDNEKKTTQLVKHWDEVSNIHKHDKKRFGLQLKKDGVCSIIVIRDGSPTIWSRTAKRFTNTWQIDKAIFSMGLRDGVYFGELTCALEGVSLEVLSGITNPNRVKPLDSKQDKIANNLTMNFFDMVSIESFIEGASQTPFQTRYNNLVERVYGTGYVPNVLPKSVHVINMFPIEPTEIDGWLNIAVKNGEEGIIIIDLDAGWEAGHKGWRKMKKVRGCDYDLLCVGYEDGKGKSKGLVANLFFKWKGDKQIKCSLGKGWTHQMAREMFHAALRGDSLGRNHGIKMSDPVGKIFQVYALEESSKGKLRLPKVGEQRHDKGEADV